MIYITRHLLKAQTNELIKSILTLKVNLEEVFLLQLWFNAVKNHNSSSMRCWTELYLGSNLHLSEGFSKISMWRCNSDSGWRWKVQPRNIFHAELWKPFDHMYVGVVLETAFDLFFHLNSLWMNFTVPYWIIRTFAETQKHNCGFIFEENGVN